MPGVRGWLLRHWNIIIISLVVVTGGALAVTGAFDGQSLETAVGLNDTEDDSDGFLDNFDNSINDSKTEQLIHEKINEARSENGAPLLTMDAELRLIARSYSQDMAERGYFSHESPEGEDFQDRYQAAGYNCRRPTGQDSYSTGAENLHKTYAFVDVRTDNGTVHLNTEEEIAEYVVNSWMNSDDHREIILKDYFRNEGIGVNVTENTDGDGKAVYVTQNFC